MKIKKLNSSGIIHHLLPMLVIIGVAIGGIYMFVDSHALTPKRPVPPVGMNQPCNQYAPINYSTSVNVAYSNDTIYDGQPIGFQGYGYGIIEPEGYKAENHIVFNSGGLLMRGYLDPYNKSLLPLNNNKPISGIVGAGFDIGGSPNDYVTWGGADICFQMSKGNWQGTQLVILEWPANNNFNEGELDIFEGNPQFVYWHIHEIGSTPKVNAVSGSWPKGLTTYGPHLISVRWDQKYGYLFYLDNKFAFRVPIKGNVALINTPHQLSFELHDTFEQHSHNPVAATIFWSDTYNYVPGFND